MVLLLRVPLMTCESDVNASMTRVVGGKFSSSHLPLFVVVQRRVCVAVDIIAAVFFFLWRSFWLFHQFLQLQLEEKHFS